MSHIEEKSQNSWFRNHLIRDAIGKALYERMKVDPSIFLFGEGAHMKMRFDSPEILKEFSDRVITLPISEDGNTNFAVGASLAGIKPVVDIIQADFLFRAMDSICNTAAKLNYFNAVKKTIVIRAEFLTGGATTGQRIENLFTRIPGINNVVVPSTPNDAGFLMNEVLQRPEMTLFFEDRMILDSGHAQEDDESEALGKARVLHRGDEITIVSYALTLQRVRGLVDSLPYSCEVVDLRTLVPLDISTIIESVIKTRNLLVVEPDIPFCSIGSQISYLVQRALPGVQARVLGGKNTIIPASMELQRLMLPTKAEIATTLDEMLC